MREYKVADPYTQHKLDGAPLRDGTTVWPWELGYTRPSRSVCLLLQYLLQVYKAVREGKNRGTAPVGNHGEREVHPHTRTAL